MTKLTTTLSLIREYSPCKDGLATLLAYLGKDYPENKEINLLTILESNGIDHFFWAFKAAKQDNDVTNRVAVQLAIAFAERVLHIFEDKYPDDDRPRKVIDSAKDYLNANTEEERKEAEFAAWETWAAGDAAKAAVRAARGAWSASSAAKAAREAVEEGDAEWAAEMAVWAPRAASAAAGNAVWAATGAEVAEWAAGSAARKEEYSAQILIIKSLLVD